MGSHSYEDSIQARNAHEMATTAIGIMPFHGDGVDDNEGFMVKWREMKTQCKLAGPLIVGNLLNFGLQLISITFVGHFGELELSGASLSNSLAIVTGVSIVLGMGGALDSLCGQAYGAKQYKKLGIYLQRAILLLNLTAIPLAFIWAYIEKILLLLGQDADIAHSAGVYIRYLIPTLFGAATSQPFMRFLQAQGLVNPLLFISFATLACHGPICYLLVFKSGFGYIGAAVANSISYWINVLLFSSYVWLSRSCIKSRPYPTWEIFHDLWTFLKLAIPSAAMTSLEWWSYEVLVILAGFLPNPTLSTATISICINTEALIFMIPYGFSAAISTRVSNELGAAKARRAHVAVQSALLLALTEVLIMSSVLLGIRHVWGKVYSNEAEVVDTVASYMPFLAISTFFDGLQAILSGVARGAGWMNVGALFNLVSYYILGLPIGILLAFKAHLSGKGLLIGLITGCITQFLLYLLITFLTDWEKEVQKAARRIDIPSTIEPLLVSSTCSS